MARTIAVIFDAIVAEKQTLATLSTLLEDSSSTATSPYTRFLADINNSSSKTAAWRLYCFIVAVTIWVHENLWDAFRTEINTLADQAISGNIPWYIRQIYAFQFGYDLVWLNNKFQYEITDEEALIIKRAAIVEAAGELRIKVAKLDGSDLPTPLDNDEKNAFTGYIGKVKFAGTKISIISDVADDLRYDISVYYNPLIGIDAVIVNTEAAIESYLGNLEFNGAINITKLVDSLQEASGINDVIINSIQARYGVLDFANIVRQYVPNAGYLKVIGGTHLGTITTNVDGSTTTTNNQNVTITYIPNV
jgi:hypothetical protein